MERSLTRQMVVLFAGRAAAFAFSFALPLVLARIFSPAEFGLYKQLFLLHGTLLAVLTFGFSASLYYFVPRHAAREQRIYISQTLLVLSIAGIAGAAALAVFRDPIARAFNNPGLGDFLPYLAAFTLLTLVASLLETLMIVLKRPELASLTNFSSELCRAVVMTAAALLTQSMLAVVLAALVWAAGRTAVLAGYLRRLGVAWWRPPDRSHLLAQFRFALPFGLALVAWTLANNLHFYAVAALYDPALFAIYSVGCLQIPALSTLFETVSDLTLVRMTELRNEGRLEEAAALLGASVTKLGVVLFPIYAWALLHAQDLLVLLFTQKFDASVGIFRVFLATVPLAALELDYVARAFGDARFILQINLLRLVLSGLLLLLLLGPLGPVGAALATVAALSLAKMVTLLKLKQLFQVPVARLLPWTRLGRIAAMSAAAAAAAALGTLPAGSAGAGLRLLLSALVFGPVYAGLVWSGGILEEEAKQRCLRSLRRLTGLPAAGLLSVKRAATGE